MIGADSTRLLNSIERVLVHATEPGSATWRILVLGWAEGWPWREVEVLPVIRRPVEGIYDFRLMGRPSGGMRPGSFPYVAALEWLPPHDARLVRVNASENDMLGEWLGPEKVEEEAAPWRPFGGLVP